MKEVVEKLFESGSYDNKNILNRASDKTLSESVLNEIENKGITSEQLDSLGVPVFKYMTQITVHGIFPDLNGSGRLFGYKYITQNKNMSLGIKYNAIDAEKKGRIYYTICKLSDYRHFSNSTENYLFKYYRCKTVEEAKEKAVELQKELNRIDKSLIFGSVGLNLLKDMFGCLYVEKYITVNAIYEKNVNAFIANVLNININEIDTKLAEKLEAEKAEEKRREEEYKAEILEKEKKQKPLFEKAENYLISVGYKKCENVAFVNDLIVLKKISVNTQTNDIFYEFHQYTKTKQQKKFRYKSVTYKNEIPQTIDFSKCYSKYETTLTSVKLCYVKIENDKPEKKQTSSTLESKTNLKETNVKATLKYEGIKLVDYSEKSFVVIGNTKPIKDTLKSLGGKFNMYLTCGCGWIFPKTKKEIVLAAIK